MLKTKKRYIILGASRGLGYQVYKSLHRQQPEAEFLLISRKILSIAVEDRTQLFAQDFSKLPLSTDLLHRVKDFNPSHVIYTAGGGPYGFFQNQKWESHQWALAVNFLYPAELLHFFSQHLAQFPDLHCCLFVGSSVAESKPDPQASSYSAAKHALRGLITTVQAENNLPFQIKLFSPGYMDTDLLPAHSSPREQGLAASTYNVAEELISFMNSVKLNWSS